MEEKNTFGNFLAVVVGTYGDSFVNSLTSLLRTFGIEFCLTRNIYTAMVEIVHKQDKDLAVFGRIESLGIDEGLFIRKAIDKGALCCCYIEGISARKQKSAIKVRDAGAFVMTNFQQIEHVLENRKSRTAKHSRGKKGSRRNNLSKEKFKATQEELDALLGT